VKITFKHIYNKHKNIPAAICCHGPSLNENKKEIEQAQNNNNVVRFSLNNWYDIFNNPPNYWILSNTSPKYHINKNYKSMNDFGCPLFYSVEGDPTSEKFIKNNLKCDFLPYDQRHFMGHECIRILKSFKEHNITYNNFDFKFYGNNNIMWHPPRIGKDQGWAGFDLYGRCCHRRVSPTIQEFLQKISNSYEHYSTADTVAFHAISFAIIMGCNPIYLSGMDLDYSLGYAKNNLKLNMDHFYIWKKNNKNLINDMKIINQSAVNRDIEIINLKKNAWYGVFNEGKFKL
jgi:hypothetical protein